MRARRQTGSRVGAHHVARLAAHVDVQRAIEAVPDQSGHVVAVRHAVKGTQDRKRPRVGRTRRRDWHASTAAREHPLQEPWLVGRRRRAAFRGATQRGNQDDEHERRRADDVSDADSAHAGDEPRWHSRHVASQHSACRSATDSHLRDGLRQSSCSRGDSSRIVARRSGVLGAQPSGDHRRTGRRIAATRSGSPHHLCAWPDG